MKKYSVPVFVRSSGDPSEGLEALRDRGACPWPDPEDPDAIDEIIGKGSARHEPAPDQVELIVDPEAGITERQADPEPIATSRQAPDYARLLLRDVTSYLASICAEPHKVEHVASELGVPKTMAKQWLTQLVSEGVLENLQGKGYVVAARDCSIPSEPHTIREQEPSTAYPDGSFRESLLGSARTYVQLICVEPRTSSKVAGELGISAKTASDWLKRLVDEGTLVKEESPVRYVVAVAHQELPLE